MSAKRAVAFHLRFGDRRLIPELKQLIEIVLSPKGVTHLLLEIDKSFVFERHPEIITGDFALTSSDANDLVKFARQYKIEIIPLMQCLGHQGWGGSRSALLTAYPEFDETPEISLSAEWPEIFCRSWCPLHPEVNDVVYDMLDELIEAFDAKYFHIGMDEVYEIASNQCDRCRGKNRADLFEKAVRDMHQHIVTHHQIEMMMWGDRLIEANRFGYDNWEADTFGTFEAVKSLPKDIIILDWHYDEREQGFPTPGYFMEQGYRVMPACWFKQNVANNLFTQAKADAKRLGTDDRYFGNIVTSWHHWDQSAFAKINQIVLGELTNESDEQVCLLKNIEMANLLSS